LAEVKANSKATPIKVLHTSDRQTNTDRLKYKYNRLAVESNQSCSFVQSTFTMNPFGSNKSGKTFLFTSESVGEGHSGKYETCFIYNMLTCADNTVSGHYIIYYTVAVHCNVVVLMQYIGFNAQNRNTQINATCMYMPR